MTIKLANTFTFWSMLEAAKVVVPLLVLSIVLITGGKIELNLLWRRRLDWVLGQGGNIDDECE